MLNFYYFLDGMQYFVCGSHDSGLPHFGQCMKYEELIQL